MDNFELQAAEHFPTEIMTATCEADGVTLRGKKAVVATYQDGRRRAFGPNSAKYRPSTVGEWNALHEAAVELGARPTFAHSWSDKILAVYEVGEEQSGIRSRLVLANSFGGTTPLCAGFWGFQPRCANTIGVSLKTSQMASIRHTKSMESKLVALQQAIAESIAEGKRIAAQYDSSCKSVIGPDEAQTILQRLFQYKKGGDTKSRKRTENLREAAIAASQMEENSEGQTLASLWNAATWLVGNKADGSKRTKGSAEPLDSLLFGTNSRRVNEIRQEVWKIQVEMADGSTEEMEALQAIELGVDAKTVARTMIEELVN